MKIGFSLLLFVSMVFAFDNTLSTNRAKIFASDQLQLSFESQVTTDPKAKLVSVSAINPIGLYQSAALQVKNHFKRAGYEGTSVTGAYAFNPFRTFEFGVSLSYLTYEDHRRHHNGTMDLGMNYRFPLHPIGGEHHLGLLANNLINVPVDGIDELLEPRSLKVGWQGEVVDRRLKLAVDLGVNLADTSFLYDLQLRFRPLFFEVGMGIANDSWEILSSASIHSVILGLGYEHESGDGVVKLFVSKKLGEVLGEAREYIHSRRKASSGGHPIPGYFWTEMLRAYHSQEYLLSLNEGGKLVAKCPDFFQNPLAYYYIAKAFQKLDSREMAMQFAFKTLSDYPASKAVPYANLLLLELSVVDGIISSASDYYKELVPSRTTPDSIKHAANYHMGRLYLQESKYDSAENYFLQVPEYLDDYENAQKELGLLKYMRAHNIKYSQLQSFCDIEEYYAVRGQFAEVSMYYSELIVADETRFVKKEKRLYTRKMKELAEKMAAYKQLIENEKNRIYKLAVGQDEYR